MTEKLILDTDMGGDIDDALALAYLLAEPRCELLGITTVSGDAVARAMIASALCISVGKDVPIFPGTAEPLIGPQRQPVAEQAALLGDLPYQRSFPAGEAIEFMRRTIRANPGEVTLLAIGPMTNVALLFAVDEEIPSLLKRLVMMVGRFNGARDRAEPNDWNALCDPHAAAIAFRAPVAVHRSVPVDVSLQVQLSIAEAKEKFHGGALEVVRQIAALELRGDTPITFHDPLAAVTIFDDGICTFERGKVEVDLGGDETMGMTRWVADADGPHEVAFEVGVEAFFAEYFRVAGK